MPLASEDCLTINVFRPSNLEPGTKLPVVCSDGYLSVTSVTHACSYFGRGCRSTSSGLKSDRTIATAVVSRRVRQRYTMAV